MSTKSKGWHEDFARFFEDPSREGLRNLLQSHVGELNSYDFKKKWPAFPRVAHHILGLSNSGGGCLIVGVEQKDDKTFDPVGLDELLDKADIQKGIQKFVPAQLKCETVDFPYDDSEYPKIVGRRFQVLFVEDSPEYIPFVARASGDGIRENAIYVRRGTSTEEANYEEIQGIINRRLETGYHSQGEFDLEQHLAELKALYNHISPYEARIPDLSISQYKKNPNYPREDYTAFVARLIEEKKEIIMRIVWRNESL